MRDGLPAGWLEVDLAILVSILDSQRVPVNKKERELRKGHVPYYGATGQVGWINDYLFDEELVLLGEDGAPFLDVTKPKAYVIQGRSWVNNHAHVLRALGSIPSVFLKYQLDQFDYRRFVGGTTRLKLNQSSLRRMPILVPPLPEQHCIVSALETHFSRLDAAVAALERARANLRRYRASVLKAACEGRLVPTEDELARREGRDYEPADRLLERILVERRRRWEEAERKKLISKGKEPKGDGWKKRYKEPEPPQTADLPPLPGGWCWVTVEQLYWDAGYGTSQKCTYEADGPPVLRIPNLRDWRLDLSDIKRAVEAGGLKSDGAVSPGDFLFVRTNGSINLIGKGALIDEQPPAEHHFASYLIRLRITTLDCLPNWFALAWHGPIGRGQLLQDAASSAGQHNISLSAVSRYVLPLPPLADQERILMEFNRCVSILAATEATIETNLRRAERLRQSILKRAFEGKLVPQDPNDEPASVLLERIRAEREADGKGGGKKRRQKDHSS